MTVSPIAAYPTEVVAVQRLSAHMVRITLSAPCLADFDDGGDLGPRDLRIKVMIPSPGHALPDLSELDAGWYPRWLALDPAERGVMRTYTVRRARIDGDRPEIDVDFVLHPGAGHHGPASTWAGRASVGDTLTVLGPDRRCGEPCRGIEWQPPADASGRVLLAGDETAAPAICSILESLRQNARGHAVIEVPTAGNLLDVRAPAGVEVVWLPRGDAPRGEALLAAVDRVVSAVVPRQLVTAGAVGARRSALGDGDGPDDLLWDTPTEPDADADLYAWVAGEASVVRSLRRQLVGVRGLRRSQVAFMGYWREGRADAV